MALKGKVFTRPRNFGHMLVSMGLQRLGLPVGVMPRGSGGGCRME